MGTHTSNPSYIKAKDILLSEYLKQCTRNEKSELSFLFKALSANTALSIQAHPNKALAEKLHKENPAAYKDDNHKPEMVIALTHFDALYGFLPVLELLKSIEANPCIKKLISLDHIHAFKSSIEKGENGKEQLKVMFQDVFDDKNHEKLEDAMKTMLSDIHKIPEEKQTEHQKLALKLHSQYGTDVGVFVSFMMNYIHLKPGESLKIDPDEVHAYVEGDCMECVATSDNVVRGGLTPKFKDIKTLTTMLTYEMRGPRLVMPIDIISDPKFSVKLYDPLFKEFVVYKVKAVKDAPKHEIDLPGWSIVFALKGDTTITKKDKLVKAVVKQYGTWLLDSGKYEIKVGHEDVELYIATEGTK